MKAKTVDALITGASTGIGRAIAIALGERGYRLALVARSYDGLAETKRLIDEGGGTATVYEVDLSDRAAITEFGKRAADQLPDLEVIANVAGVWHGATTAYYGPLLHETPEAEVIEVIDVTLVAPILLTRALLPSIAAKGHGHVINISGTFAHGGKGWLHYFVAKRGLEQFTVALADELRDSGIQVNCISPADVATEAYKRFFAEHADSALRPEEIAEVASWLLTTSARNISGQIIEVRRRNA